MGAKKGYYHGPCGSPMKGHKRSSDGSWICPESDRQRYSSSPGLPLDRADSPNRTPLAREWNNRSSSNTWPTPSTGLRNTPPPPSSTPSHDRDESLLMHRANMKQIQPGVRRKISSSISNAPTIIIGENEPPPPLRPIQESDEYNNQHQSSSTMSSTSSGFRRFVGDSRMLGAIFKTTRDEVHDYVQYLTNADVHFSIVGRPSHERSSAEPTPHRPHPQQSLPRDPSCVIVMAHDEQTMNVLASTQRGESAVRGSSEPYDHEGLLDITRDDQRRISASPTVWRQRDDFPFNSHVYHHRSSPTPGPLYPLSQPMHHSDPSTPTHSSLGSTQIPGPADMMMMTGRHNSLGSQGHVRFSSVGPLDRDPTSIQQGMNMNHSSSAVYAITHHNNGHVQVSRGNIFAIGLVGALTAIFGLWLGRALLS